MNQTITRMVLIAILLVPRSALACMWDYDTLAMEREQFPSALELITGKFLRHSSEFYEWRVRDRLARLESNPADLQLYDDLAVAYDKLGQHGKAIETILKKDAIRPDQYETHANLGTFLIHSGELERGGEHIERAIAINPDAHFGREIYQKHLVNYVLSKQENGETQIPLDASERRPPRVGFAAYLNKARGRDDSSAIDRGESKRATKGVLGMMRFGHYDSPVLLEALGDLLSVGWGDDAKRLAARAYLKASYETQDEIARAAYRKMAGEVLRMQTVHGLTMNVVTLESIEKTFLGELDEANRWHEAVRDDEIRWIELGKNLDEEFSRKYYSEPSISRNYSAWLLPLTSPFIYVPALVLCLFGTVRYIQFRQKRKLADGPTG